MASGRLATNHNASSIHVFIGEGSRGGGAFNDGGKVRVEQGVLLHGNFPFVGVFFVFSSPFFSGIRVLFSFLCEPLGAAALREESRDETKTKERHWVLCCHLVN